MCLACAGRGDMQRQPLGASGPGSPAVPRWVTVPTPPATWGGQCSTAPCAQSWGRCRPPTSLSPSRLRCGAALSRAPQGGNPPPPPSCHGWSQVGCGLSGPINRSISQAGQGPRRRESGPLGAPSRAGWDRGCGVPLTSERKPGGWAGLTSGGLGAPGAQISGLWGGRGGLGLGSTRCDQLGPGGHS